MERPKINLQEVLGLYGTQEQKSSVPIEQLNIQDRGGVQATVKQATKEGLAFYDEIKSDTPSIEVKDKPEFTLKYYPVSSTVVDSSVPLSLFILKSYTIDKATGAEKEEVHFHLFKGAHQSLSPAAFIRVWKEGLENGSETGGMRFEVKNGVMDLTDRLVDERFRGQGIGSYILDAGEEFAQQKANQKQTKETVSAETAQLDVISWLYNKGYRPKTAQDRERLDKILNPDDSLCLGEKLFVFESSVPPAQRTWENFKNSYRIRLEKPVEPQQSADLTTVLREVKTEVSDLLK